LGIQVGFTFIIAMEISYRLIHH